MNLLQKPAPKPWEIWYADVQFEEGVGSKKRPVLVLENGVGFVLSFKITSQLKANGYQITRWAEASLNRASILLIHKKISINSQSFIFKIGRLHPADIINVNRLMKTTP